jgi:hypothetical protein
LEVEGVGVGDEIGLDTTFAFVQTLLLGTGEVGDGEEVVAAFEVVQTLLESEEIGVEDEIGVDAAVTFSKFNTRSKVVEPLGAET